MNNEEMAKTKKKGDGSPSLIPTKEECDKGAEKCKSAYKSMYSQTYGKEPVEDGEQ